MGLEAPVPDAVEQSRTAIPDADERTAGTAPQQFPLEADEADAAEQSQDAGPDEDDYR